ncbi:twin-arginine translocation signal domain-containing protein [Microbispora triticiradicis]|uniref:Twin-arginine translocation signal domain-containing protein n=2 Tax=Microbispora TaxID=2005 RepID=A0ABY3M409_9ACTN|nr:twin-arginine translocation signal domain-containing protein [Microbispora fusca]TYB66300.1 twin-arginine translocation signal domain-containing protein [Microbispora tritici]
MCENRAGDAASELTRRRFIQFSGLAGAGVLAGAGLLADGGHALAVPPPSLVKGPDPKECGKTSDSDSRRRSGISTSCTSIWHGHAGSPGTTSPRRTTWPPGPWRTGRTRACRYAV